jgi:hypothetical protein
MKRSEVVSALADLASQGTYTVKPPVAQQMNSIFVAVAQLINELEAEEANEDNNNE